MKSRDNKPISISGFNRNSELADELSGFYLRFDNGPKSNFFETSVYTCLTWGVRTLCVENSSLTPTAWEQCLEKAKLEKKKTLWQTGLQGNKLRKLKVCAEQLRDILSYLFNVSTEQQEVPQLWKVSIVVPIAKNKSPTSSMTSGQW